LSRPGARATAYGMVVLLAALVVVAVPSGSGRVRAAVARAAAQSRVGDTTDDQSLEGPAVLAPALVQAQGGTDTIVVAGRIATNLYAALDSCASTIFPLRARSKLAWSIADIYEYRIDMSRDLRVGDTFRVLVERTVTPSDSVRAGRILAAIFVESRDTLTAVDFPQAGPVASSQSLATEYYDVRGRSLRAAFLRAPVEFRRISSGFGMRKHPILGIWREHKGTDYVAPEGTPVRAIGDGVVLFAGQRGGYGNMIDLRHHNGYVTRYGHLSRFAPGIRRGVRVTIGKTIAYVGMTGLATGPHLHFEVLVDGVQRDPRVALRDRGAGIPVPDARRSAFDETAHRTMAELAKTPPDAAIAAK
jgi:murein DD-endopeptidase MepM/ murein hydrolase activator NlpD